jgi:hypothetical protein
MRKPNAIHFIKGTFGGVNLSFGKLVTREDAGE